MTILSMATGSLASRACSEVGEANVRVAIQKNATMNWSCIICIEKAFIDAWSRYDV